MRCQIKRVRVRLWARDRIRVQVRVRVRVSVRVRVRVSVRARGLRFGIRLRAEGCGLEIGFGLG